MSSKHVITNVSTEMLGSHLQTVMLLSMEACFRGHVWQQGALVFSPLCSASSGRLGHNLNLLSPFDTLREEPCDRSLQIQQHPYHRRLKLTRV